MPVKKRTAALDWEDVRYFVALARHGTLSAAARALRVNHATVARRVGSLEALLGKTLFERRADGYLLTAQGKAVLDSARVMDEAALSVLHRQDAGTELNGLVRVTAARPLVERFLVDRLGAFYRRYPSIDVELLAELRVMSLARREADIALRFGSPKDSELVARRIGAIAYGFYGTPAYRDRLKSGQAATFIGYDEDSDFIAEAAWLARQFGDRRFSFRSNSQVAQAAAARAGYGMALLPRYLAAADPGLVPIPRAECLPGRDVWLLVRRELKQVPRVRALADYLAELFRRERRLLAG